MLREVILKSSFTNKYDPDPTAEVAKASLIKKLIGEDYSFPGLTFEKEASKKEREKNKTAFVLMASLYEQMDKETKETMEVHIDKDMSIVFQNTDLSILPLYHFKNNNCVYFMYLEKHKEMMFTNTMYLSEEQYNMIRGVILYLYSSGLSVDIFHAYVLNNYTITFPRVVFSYHLDNLPENGIIEWSGTNNIAQKESSLMGNIILYTQSHPEWVERIQLPIKQITGKMGKRKRQEVELGNKYSIIHKIGIPKQIKNCIRAKDFEGDSHKINKRFMVRGHWRNQVCGQGRQERRLQFIAPFWKGTEEMPLIEHVYQIS